MIYCFACRHCGAKFERDMPAFQGPRRAKCDCGKTAFRSLRDEHTNVQTDPELCLSDYDRHVGLTKDLDVHKTDTINSRALSVSLARVPGIPKVRGKDGRVRAGFRNMQHRRQVLKKVGVPDG